MDKPTNNQGKRTFMPDRSRPNPYRRPMLSSRQTTARSITFVRNWESSSPISQLSFNLDSILEKSSGGDGEKQPTISQRVSASPVPVVIASESPVPHIWSSNVSEEEKELKEEEEEEDIVPETQQSRLEPIEFDDVDPGNEEVVPETPPATSKTRQKQPQSRQKASKSGKKASKTEQKSSKTRQKEAEHSKQPSENHEKPSGKPSGGRQNQSQTVDESSKTSKRLSRTRSINISKVSQSSQPETAVVSADNEAITDSQNSDEVTPQKTTTGRKRSSSSSSNDSIFARRSSRGIVDMPNLFGGEIMSPQLKVSQTGPKAKRSTGAAMPPPRTKSVVKVRRKPIESPGDAAKPAQQSESSRDASKPAQQSESSGDESKRAQQSESSGDASKHAQHAPPGRDQPAETTHDISHENAGSISPEYPNDISPMPESSPGLTSSRETDGGISSDRQDDDITSPLQPPPRTSSRTPADNQRSSSTEQKTHHPSPRSGHRGASKKRLSTKPSSGPSPSPQASSAHNARRSSRGQADLPNLFGREMTPQLKLTQTGPKQSKQSTAPADGLRGRSTRGVEVEESLFDKERHLAAVGPATLATQNIPIPAPTPTSFSVVSTSQLSGGVKRKRVEPRSRKQPVSESEPTTSSKSQSQMTSIQDSERCDVRLWQGESGKRAPSQVIDLDIILNRFEELAYETRQKTESVEMKRTLNVFAKGVQCNLRDTIIKASAINKVQSSVTSSENHLNRKRKLLLQSQRELSQIQYEVAKLRNIKRRQNSVPTGESSQETT